MLIYLVTYKENDDEANPDEVWYIHPDLNNVLKVRPSSVHEKITAWDTNTQDSVTLYTATIIKQLNRPDSCAWVRAKEQ